MNGNGFLTRLQQWAAKPFSEEMDAWNWVLFTAFVVTVAVLWTRVLRTVTKTASE